MDAYEAYRRKLIRAARIKAAISWAILLASAFLMVVGAWTLAVLILSR